MLSFYRTNLRWLAGGFLLCLFSSFGQTFFIGLWSAPIRTEFALSHGDFGVLYMAATLASAACLPFAAAALDRVPVALVAGGVIAALAVAAFAMSVATHVAVLVFTLFLLRLFGQGMMTQTAMTAMGRWYAANRGKAVSAAGVGLQFGEATLPSLSVLLTVAVGWRASWALAGALLLLVALPCVVILMWRERTPRGTSTEDGASGNERQWTRNEVLRDPLFWLAGIGIFAMPFIGTSIFFHQAHLIEVNGWNPNVFYGSFALMAATTFLCALGTGVAIDRVTAVRLLPSSIALLTLACAALAFGSGDLAVVSFFVLLGLSYGTGSALFGAFWPEVYGTRHLGAVRGVTLAIAVFMTAAGPGVTGTLIDWGYDFRSQLVAITAFCVFGTAVLFVASALYRTRLRTQSASTAM